MVKKKENKLTIPSIKRDAIILMNNYGLRHM